MLENTVHQLGLNWRFSFKFFSLGLVWHCFFAFDFPHPTVFSLRYRQVQKYATLRAHLLGQTLMTDVSFAWVPRAKASIGPWTRTRPKRIRQCNPGPWQNSAPLKWKWDSHGRCCCLDRCREFRRRHFLLYANSPRFMLYALYRPVQCVLRRLQKIFDQSSNAIVHLTATNARTETAFITLPILLPLAGRRRQLHKKRSGLWHIFAEIENIFVKKKPSLSLVCVLSLRVCTHFCMILPTHTGASREQPQPYSERNSEAQTLTFFRWGC